ncbi:MAG: hypothetical protein GC152_11660 [Alphaproteobacteria bacterium]|nr:hypothetical protein [Alphaproteobacteria bacterium]
MLGEATKRDGWPRAIGARFSGAALVLAVMVAGCVDQVDEAPLVSADACQLIDLYDERTGDRIVGAEDLAVDRIGGRLFVSAYDRRAVEKAVGQRSFLLPEGGLYELPLSRLQEAGGRLVAATPVISGNDVPGGLRPHGIDYDPVTGDLAFINRAYQKINGHWRRSSRLERVNVSSGPRHERLDMSAQFGVADGWSPQLSDGEPHCAANDVVEIGGEALVSFDHGACGWRAAVEDAFGFAHAGIAAERGGAIFSGARFANGVAQSVTGEIVLAQTRDKSIAFITDAGRGLAETRRAETPGGPDNLTIGPDGGIIAAVHPSLPWIGLHRHFGVPRAPSRIVRVDPESLEVTLLYEDLRGDYFPAATVAVETENNLILGSVTAPGVLVCDLPRTDGGGN